MSMVQNLCIMAWKVFILIITDFVTNTGGSHDHKTVKTFHHPYQILLLIGWGGKQIKGTPWWINLWDSFDKAITGEDSQKAMKYITTITNHINLADRREA